MAGAKFQYDESGGTFFYFLLAFQCLIVVPCTYYFYPRNISQREKEQRRDKTVCHCEKCCIKNSRLRSREPYHKAKQRLIKLVLLIGWTALFLTAYKVAHLKHDYVAYDPFEILQIPPAASMVDIKKAYRRLSLVYHPDKETGDEKKFMMIAKAYAALTDDEARKNWELYGNPDGPGATSFGIALPSWIVEKENSVLVLGIYALVFMISLPVAVGVWWYRSVKFGGDEVLLDTTQLYYFFINKTPHMILKRVMIILAASLEYDKGHNNEIIERPSDNIEVPQLIKEFPNFGERNKERPICFSYSIKARALIHAHMSRLNLSNNLEEDKLYVISKCPYLLQEFVRCASQLTMLALTGRISRIPSLDTVENAMKLSPCIVQALKDNQNSLLQLPHISGDILRHFTGKKRNIRNIKQLACMKSDDRRAMLRSLSGDQYDDVINVIAKMPIIDIEVKSEVLDDEDSCTITAKAIVTVTATLYRRDMKTLFDQEELNHTHDVDLQEDELQQERQPAIANGESPKTKKPKVWERQKKKKGGKSSRERLKKRTVFSSAVMATPAINKKNTNDSDPPPPLNGIIPQQSKAEEKTNLKESDESADGSEKGEAESDSDGSCSQHSASEGQNVETEDSDWEKFQNKVTKHTEKILETKSKKSHIVHCPYYPDEKQEYWFVYLADKKRHSLITSPYLVTNLVDKEEVELKFTAPNKPGIYTYSVIVRSDSYMDFDVVKAIKLDVKEAKVVDLTKLQWDISEEEEKDEEESAVEDSDLASDDDDEELDE